MIVDKNTISFLCPKHKLSNLEYSCEPQSYKPVSLPPNDLLTEEVKHTNAFRSLICSEMRYT